MQCELGDVWDAGGREGGGKGVGCRTILCTTSYADPLVTESIVKLALYKNSPGHIGST